MARKAFKLKVVFLFRKEVNGDMKFFYISLEEAFKRFTDAFDDLYSTFEFEYVRSFINFVMQRSFLTAESYCRRCCVVSFVLSSVNQAD